jgi:drug/metabolite transporter (DMT)-like permease
VSAPAALPRGGRVTAPREHLRGLVLCAAGVIVISPDALIVRSVRVDAWTTIFWRGAFTAAGTLTMLAVLRRLSIASPAASARARRLGPQLGAGALFAAASVAFISALDRTDAASVLVIIAAGPLIASVLGRIFFHERTPARTWLAGAGVVCGLALIVGSAIGRGEVDGDLFALAGATCFAGYLTVARAARPTDMTPAIAVGGAGAALVGWLAGADLTIAARDLLLLLLLGGLILPVSLALITRATRHLPAPEVNLVALLETVLGPIWVWIGLGERPTATVVAAGLIVVAAVTVHSALALRSGEG